MKKFYSSCYLSQEKNGDKDKFIDSIKVLKNDFVNQFQISISENFNRAYILVKNIEKNAEENGKFEKENIVNVHIIEHLVDYIKKLSQSFTDLYDDFYSETQIDFYSPKDSLITELRSTFTTEILSSYFLLIFSKIDEVLSTLSSGNSNNDRLLIQKFFYFYYILYKMNDVFISFLNSNVSYLISNVLRFTISEKMSLFMSMFYSIILGRISFKTLLINKEDFNYYISFTTDLINELKIFFLKENYNNNKAYEKPILKIILYVYSLCSVLLLIMKCKVDFKAYDNILNKLNEIIFIFLNINFSEIIIRFHKTIKLIANAASKEELDEIKEKEECGEAKSLLLKIRLLSFNDKEMISFLMNNKIKEGDLIYLLALLVLKNIKVNINDINVININESDNSVVNIKEFQRKLEEKINLFLIQLEI